MRDAAPLFTEDPTPAQEVGITLLINAAKLLADGRAISLEAIHDEDGHEALVIRFVPLPNPALN